jgi:hypothetical protein
VLKKALIKFLKETYKKRNIKQIDGLRDLNYYIKKQMYKNKRTQIH